MKKFMKKIIAFLMVFLMLFNACSVFAAENEITEEVIAIEEVAAHDPVRAYKVVSDTVVVDEKAYEANLLLNELRFGNGLLNADVYVQIAPLAREFGYVVNYIEETDSVVFEKDGKKRILDIKERRLDEEDGTYITYIDTISYKDRTYVDYAYVPEIVENIYAKDSYYPYSEENDYSYYTAGFVVEKYKAAFNGFEKINKLFEGKTYKSSSKGEASLEFTIKDLGIGINGSVAIDASSLVDNNKFRFDISMKSDGLMNIIDLAKQLIKDEEAQINFDESIDFSMLYDGENMYTKGDLNSLMLSEYYITFEEGYPAEETERFTEEMENGWLRTELSPFVPEYPMTTDGLIKLIVENSNSYEEAKSVLDMLSAISSYMGMLTANDKDGANYRIEINKDMLASTLKLLGIEFPDELKDVDIEEFNLVAEALYRNDLSGKSKTDGVIVINKLFPLNEKTRMGEITLTLNSDGITEATDERITTPDSYINLENQGEYFE